MMGFRDDLLRPHAGQDAHRGPWLLSNLLGIAALVGLFFGHPVLSPVAVGSDLAEASG